MIINLNLVNMSKVLKGNIFLYSANDLETGRAVYFSLKYGWQKDVKKASKILKDDIRKFENIVKLDQSSKTVIGPYLIEINKDGSIVKLREKIRLENEKILKRLNV